jgi:L-Ala-D/L-Glu epimerase
MKIVKFETFPISVGYSHAELSARVRHGGVSDVIVKLTADNGLIGWARAAAAPIRAPSMPPSSPWRPSS